ncbi:MAG: hypothetical protein ACREP8_09695 [Candidatus Binatia bacterium]
MSRPIPEPILHYSVDLFPHGTDQRHFGVWRDVGQYWVWSGAALAGDPRHIVFEKVESGVIDFTPRGYLLHPILSGKIHHISHLFGYWHASDADRIWIHFPRGEISVSALIWGGKTGAHQRDRLLWFCPRCGNRLAERVLDTGKGGIEAFVAEQLDAVREFNSDAERRKCKNCGFVHPEAYGFYPKDDSAMEKAAREQW